MEVPFCKVTSTVPDRGAAFTLLTPGPDVASIHDRQMIVLKREDWGGWVNRSKPEAALLAPLPAGSLQVEQGAVKSLVFDGTTVDHFDGSGRPPKSKAADVRRTVWTTSS